LLFISSYISNSNLRINATEAKLLGYIIGSCCDLTACPGTVKVPLVITKATAARLEHSLPFACNKSKGT